MTASEMGKRGAAARLRHTTKADRSALGRMGQAARMRCNACGAHREPISRLDPVVMEFIRASREPWATANLSGYRACLCLTSRTEAIPDRAAFKELIEARGRGGNFSWRNRRWVEIDAMGKTVCRPPLDKIKRGTR